VKQIVPKIFVTFDLDAQDEVQKHLLQIGLQDRRDFTAVGKDKPGKRAIEGLLPERVFKAVYAKEVHLVAAAMGETTDVRKSAKNELKRKLLDEFKAHEDYTESELKEFEQLGKMILKAFT
jgi:hypothetical protein